MTERTTGIENEPLEFQEEWLSAYLDGELTSEQRSAVEARLQYDSNVQQMLLDLQKVRSLVAGLPAWPSAFGGLQDFQVPDKFDDGEFAEPSPTAGEVFLRSAKPVEDLEPLTESTFDAPRQNDIEEPPSPPLKMQASEEVLDTSREREGASEPAQAEIDFPAESSQHEEQAAAYPEPTPVIEQNSLPKKSIPETDAVADPLAADYPGNDDESVEAVKQPDWDDGADEGAALEGDESELVAPARESANYFSDESKPSILPRLATAASLLAMLGLGYFLWEPIADSIGVAARPENSAVEDSLGRSAVRSRPESDEKSPASSGAALAKKSENFSGGEAADESVDGTRPFGMAGSGALPFAEPQSSAPQLEQSRLPEPMDSSVASNSQVDKSALPTGVVPPAMDSPRVQSRRMQSGFGGRGGLPRTRSLGGGGGGLPPGGGGGLPPAGMKQAPLESEPGAPGSAAPKMMKMQNGFHLAESKVEGTESAAPVMEMAPAENLPDRPLSEVESPENAPRLGAGLPTPPASQGPEPGGQITTIAGLDLSLLPQLHRQTKVPLSRYEVVSDGSWSLDQMKRGLLRLKNRSSQSDAPEAAIGEFEGTTELLLEQILEDVSYQRISRSLVNRGRQQPVGEAASGDFSEATTASRDPEEKNVAPVKSILLFTNRAAAEKLLQSKSISKATEQYLWLRSPNGKENPADKVLLLLNPK